MTWLTTGCAWSSTSSVHLKNRRRYPDGGHGETRECSGRWDDSSARRIPPAAARKAALAALERHPEFDVRLTPPERLTVALRQAVSSGVPRVLVAGGDGTIASAASVLVLTSTALAVLPGGTLNHFARDQGIPTDLEEALQVAERGRVARVNVGYVNDQLFLNTSSVGSYVRFVETRERLERHVGYRVASVVAGIRILRDLRPMRVTLEVEDTSYRRPPAAPG